eukprot:Awhi_evm2s379
MANLWRVGRGRAPGFISHNGKPVSRRCKYTSSRKGIGPLEVSPPELRDLIFISHNGKTCVWLEVLSLSPRDFIFISHNGETCVSLEVSSLSLRDFIFISHKGKTCVPLEVSSPGLRDLIFISHKGKTCVGRGWYISSSA